MFCDIMNTLDTQTIDKKANSEFMIFLTSLQWLKTPSCSKYHNSLYPVI